MQLREVQAEGPRAPSGVRLAPVTRGGGHRADVKPRAAPRPVRVCLGNSLRVWRDGLWLGDGRVTGIAAELAALTP